MLAALFTVLAFQPLRFESYETEKVGLLYILVVLIVGANLARGMGWRVAWRSPLTWAVMTLLVSVTLSTFFSLSFTRSLWGSAYRMQGLAAYLCYGVLFWQASRTGARTRSRVTSFLMILTVPLCFFILMDHYIAGLYQPGASAGNINFVSAWLMMALLYLAPELWTEQRKARRVLVAGVCGLILLTMLIFGRRGSVMGLGAGLVMAALMVGALQRRRRLVMGLVVLLVVGGAGYVLLSRAIEPDSATGVRRLLRPYDPERALFWASAADLLANQSEPLHAWTGTPDPWAMLRPLIGYGPDTLDQIHGLLVDYHPEIEELSVTRDTARQAIVIDRFHNVFFDMRAMTGWLGLVAFVAVYEAVLYLGLRGLGLLRPGQWWQVMAAQAAGVPFGIGLTSVVVVEMETRAIAPVGVMLGGLLGMMAWVGWQAFTPGEARSLDARRAALTGVLCVAVGRWVELQFGFQLAMTEPLWWVLMGLLVSLAAPDAPAENSKLKPGVWYDGALAAGLFLIYSLRAPVQTQPLGGVVVLLGVICGLGLLGAALSRASGIDWACASRMLLVWVVFLLARDLWDRLAVAPLEAGMTGRAVSTVQMYWSGLLLSLSGVVVCLAVVGALVKWRALRQLKWQQMAVIAGCLAVGCAAYLSQSAGAVLHGVGLRFAGQFETRQYTVMLGNAYRAYEAALWHTPANTQIRIHWIYLLRQEARTGDEPPPDIEARIAAQAQEAFTWEPFLPNAWEWQSTAARLAPP